MTSLEAIWRIGDWLERFAKRRARPVASLRFAAFGLDSNAVPRGLRRAPSRALARPVQPALEQLVPSLMSAVAFSLAHEQPDPSALRPASLGLDASFAPPARAAEGAPAPAPEAPARERPTLPETETLAWARSRTQRRAPLPASLTELELSSRDRAWSERAAPDASARSFALDAEALALDFPELADAQLTDLGAARPEHFRIDETGRVPSERDAPAITTDRPPPPAPGRYLRPRTPLARAPLSRVDGTAFRLDPRTGALPNESIIEARPQPLLPSWYLDDYDRDFYRRWTPFIYIWGLGPLQNEWFSYWWVEFREQKLGGFPPFPFRENREIKWLVILRCKEQMLIRRDVKKLEKAPELSGYFYEVQGVAILQHERLLKLAELIEKPTWVEITRIVRDNHDALHPWLDACSDWRTLLAGLAEPELIVGTPTI